MPIDVDRALSIEIPPVSFEVERGRLRLFARAIGETDPIYSDLDAAKAAGHRDLFAPPTFFFSMELESPDPFWYLRELNVDLGRILHGEQSFVYHSLAYVGDRVDLTARLVDVISKKSGALEILTKQTEIRRDEELIGEATTVIVVRNPGA